MDATNLYVTMRPMRVPRAHMAQPSASMSGPASGPAGVTPILAPHPAIDGAYGTLESKREFLDTIFDETARDYDRVERWLSLGTGRWYRRKALERAGLRAGMRVLDVAIGTGLLAGEAISIIGPAGHLVGVDPSQEMMRQASERLGVETVRGVADSLPFNDASFDFVSMGYALRHVEDLRAAFREFHRVLKPTGPFGGGRVCILEVTRPATRIARAMLRLHLGVTSRLAGTLFRLAPRTPELWAYYGKTIEQCVPPEHVLEALKSEGFVDAKRSVVAGIFSEFTATRG